MNEHYPPIYVDATPDDIMAIISDLHRQQCACDWEDYPKIVLTHESSVNDWRQGYDFVGWRALAEATNTWWSVDIPLEHWRGVLEPAKGQKLREVCTLLAQHAKIPRVRAARLLGSECLPAGAFLTIRSYLAAAGADGGEIAPSTPLAEYTRRYSGVFLAELSRLAPGALPTVKISRPLLHGCSCGFALSWIGITIGCCAGLHVLSAFSAIVAIVAFLGLSIAAWFMRPASVEFAGLRTFRDLSLAVAAGASRP
ncbi:MAG: hypothetical protein ABSH20_00875 [Tepidisphaeraceae bacterium]|jgi:hypothetical protein